MEFTLLAAVLTGVAAMWLTLRLTGETAEFDRLVGAAVAGVFVGRLAAMLGAGVNPVTRPLDLLVVRGGVATAGAAAGAVAFLAWSARHDWVILDRVAPAAVAGLAGWHGGCLWRGTCLGAAGDVPWGWTLEGSAVTRHPVELYAAGLMLAGAFVLTRFSNGSGVRAALALVIVAGARLATEPIRPSLGGGPVAAYWVAVAVGVAAALVLGRRK